MVDVILRPHSASSNHPLCSLNRPDLLKFHVAELLWPSLDPLPQLVPLFGMHSLLLYTLLFFHTVFRLPLPLSKPIFSHGALHTGSASERLTQLEALYKCLNTIQCYHPDHSTRSQLLR